MSTVHAFTNLYSLSPIDYMDEDGKLLINEGEFFGMLVSPNYDFTTLFSDVDTSKPEMEYRYSSDGFYMDKIGNENIPLILKKLGGNLALELISGLTVEIDNPDHIDKMAYKNLPVEQYDEFIKHYSPRGYVIDCVSEGETLCYKVDDVFKKLFSDYYQNDSKRLSVANYLKKNAERAKKDFAEAFKQNIDEIHGIANVDNMIYDAGGRNL